MTTRRAFLQQIALGLSAAVVLSGILMPVRRIWVPRNDIKTIRFLGDDYLEVEHRIDGSRHRYRPKRLINW